MRVRPLHLIGVVTAVTIPWMLVWGASWSLSTLATVLVSGVAILGAAFLLAWAAETAEKDVPRSFAIAVLAVLAVAPEYAVDAHFAWQAGQFAGTPDGVEASNLAVANMTGANRILIGLGWSGIALFTIYRGASSMDPAVQQRAGFLADAVTIDRDLALELVFLLAATAWAFLIPLGGGIDALDMLVLVGLYAAYIVITIRGDVEPADAHTGVPAYLQRQARPARIATVLGLFAYSGLVIFVAVEPFAHGLAELGTAIGVPSFFMIQWVAPLASESPELIVVAYLVNKARSTAGFNALISSKLNQWTLLIGTLVLVYSLGLGRYGALSFDPKQSAEIWITAAQSLFAVAILTDLEITAREALALLALFSSQVALELAMIREWVTISASIHDVLLAYSAVYVLLALVLFVSRRRHLRALVTRAAGTVESAFSKRDRPPYGD